MSTVSRALPAIKPDLYAEGWNNPDEPPHWDGIRDQVREWLRQQCFIHTRTDRAEPIPQFRRLRAIHAAPQRCVVRVMEGQTPGDLDVPPIHVFWITDDEGGDVAVLSAAEIETRDGQTFVRFALEVEL